MESGFDNGMAISGSRGGTHGLHGHSLSQFIHGRTKTGCRYGRVSQQHLMLLLTSCQSTKYANMCATPSIGPWQIE